MSPIGQAQFNQVGTYQWTCPPGVTKVAVALVGAGGVGRAVLGFTGNGGNVRYINEIPVVPGNIYPIVIPPNTTGQAANNTTSGFGYTANSPLNSTVKGGDGSSGISGRYAEMEGGGNVGLIGAGRYSQGIDLKTFAATSPTGTFSRDGGKCGGGGGYWKNRQDGEGGPGGVRIIWGDNRSFPSSNIGDMPSA
ncbi:hypothetical protein D3C86_1468190 [compost metagenome]